MFMRRRPLLRAAVIGGGAYVAGKKSAQRSAEQDQAQQQDQQNEDEQNERIASLEQQKQASAAPTPTMLDQLNQLNTLHQQGALTDTEFTVAKSKLLGSGG
jgi:hypothetical protein